KDVGFMDITDHQEVRALATPAKKRAYFLLKKIIFKVEYGCKAGLTNLFTNLLNNLALPMAAFHQDKFALYVDNISNANMQTALTAFTQFNNRYYNAQTGVDSATWLEKQIADLI